MQKAEQCISGHWLGSLQVLRIKQRLLILQPSLIRFCTSICNGWLVISKLLPFPEMGWYLYSKLFPSCEGFLDFFLNSPCFAIVQKSCKETVGRLGLEIRASTIWTRTAGSPPLPPLHSPLDCLECKISTSFCFSTFLSVRQCVYKGMPRKEGSVNISCLTSVSYSLYAITSYNPHLFSNILPFSVRLLF